MNNPRAPDLTYLSLGGGVQSSTIAEMMVEGDFPAADAVVFADTGDEPETVYAHVDYLKTRIEGAGIRFDTVSAGNITQDIRDGRRFAPMPLFTKTAGKKGRMRRQCTKEYKIEPIERLVRTILEERGMAARNKSGALRVQKGVNAHALLGISLDEIGRMKASRIGWVENVYPLVDLRMRRSDCVSYLRSHGLPIPEKSSCRVCPFHSDAHWRKMAIEHPEDWEHVTDFDDFLRQSNRLSAKTRGDLFLHPSCVPLRLVDLRNEHDRGQLEMFEEICEDGYCFT